MTRTTCLLAAALSSCGGSQGPTAADGAPPVRTSDVRASEPAASASAPAVEVATSSTPKAGRSAEHWSVGSGDANGVSYENDLKQPFTVAKLSWTQFLRQTDQLGKAELPTANVSFATLTVDGATASDSLCRLSPWPSPPTDPLTMTTALVGLLVIDAAPIVPVLKSKAALLACSGGKKLRLRFAVERSQWADVAALGADARTSACVKSVLEKTIAASTATCVTTVEP